MLYDREIEATISLGAGTAVPLDVRKALIVAAKQAILLCEQVRRSQIFRSINKSDRSPVTIADFVAQAVICRELARAFPEDVIVAEESASLLRQPTMIQQLVDVTWFVQRLIPEATAEEVLFWIDRGRGQAREVNRFWTIDPIDGTKGFLRGDHYAIAIALIEDGEVKMGILGCPSLIVGEMQGCLLVAERGQGSQVISLQTGESCFAHVLESSNSPNFRLTESVELGHGNPILQRTIAQAVGLTAPALQMDSQAKYGAIATGQAALYMRLPWAQVPNYEENIWDHAAGAIVVEEAGGRVSDMDGKPLDFTVGSKLVKNRGIIASNGILHEAVLATIQAKKN